MFFYQHILRLLFAGIGIVAIIFAGGIGWFWVQRNRIVILPAPSGPYAVGRVAYEWTDLSRLDPLADTPNQKRTLTVWIWYPAAPTVDTAPAPYLPAAWVQARKAMMGIGALLTQNLTTIQAHAIADAPVAPNRTPYPVLVMQPGLGPLIADYTTLAEALASQGYVVVGSNPSYSANVVVFGDGRRAFSTTAGNVPDNASLAEAQVILDRLIMVWAADDRFIFDQLAQLNAATPPSKFTGRLDLQAIGVWGHSFGGATAAQVCQLDARCKAGVDLDGYPYGPVVQQGLHQPFLFMWSEPPTAVDAGWQQAQQATQAIATHWPHDHYELTIQGMRHFNFTDYALIFSPLLHVMGGIGPIDGQRGLVITVTYVQAFFDRYLKGQDAPLLTGPVRIYPEVHFSAP